jgi:hypothetical protein
MVLPILIIAAAAVGVGAIAASATSTKKAAATPLGVHPLCVVIRSHHGKYLTLSAADGKSIKADAATAGASEVFQVIPLGEKKVPFALLGRVSLPAASCQLLTTDFFLFVICIYSMHSEPIMDAM